MRAIWISAPLLAASAFWAGAAPPASGAAERLIQIGIVPRAQELSFVCEGKFTLRDSRGQNRELASRQEYRVEAEEGGLRLGSLALSGSARLEPEDASGTVLIGRQRYRGILILKPNDDGTLTVVHELGIEDYLLGVLPREMDPDWPLEALKAQAVVARTFAYTHLGKFRRAGYDLSSDTRSQMYAGLGEVSPSVRRAVEETRGEVLGYKGRILDAYYHSCCGGHTTSVASAWGSDSAPQPPLRGVRDKYCLLSPHARWSAYFSAEDLLAALHKRRLIAGTLRAFEVASRDPAGYVKAFLVKVGGERVLVRAGELRSWLGSTELKSVRISRVRLRRKGVEFEGAGLGHGVGLCQWGARGQAEEGRRYEKILKFYFPGSILSVIDE